MSQRAKLDGENIHAFSVESDDEWAALVRASDEDTLKMPCCGARTICKTSINGRHFFSHPPHSLQNCDAAVESERHEDIKIAVAKAISELNGWHLETEAGCDILCHWEQSNVKVGIEVELPSWEASEAYQRRDNLLRADGKTPLWLIGRYQVEEFPNLKNRFELQYSPREKTISDAKRIAVGFLTSISTRLKITSEVVKILGDEGYNTDIETSLSVPVFINAQRLTDTVRINLDERVAKFTFDKQLMKFDHSRKRAQKTFDEVYKFFRQADNLFRVYGQGMPKTVFEGHKQDVIDRNKGFSSPAMGTKQSENEYTRSDVRTSSASDFISNEVQIPDYGQLRSKLVRDVAVKVMSDDQVEEWMHSPNPAFSDLTPLELAQSDSNAVFEVEVHLGLRDRLTRRPINLT